MFLLKTVCRAAVCSALFVASSFGASYFGIGYSVADSIAQNATLANFNAQGAFTPGAANTNYYDFSASAVQFTSHATAGSSPSDPNPNSTTTSWLESLGSDPTGTAVYNGSVTASTNIGTGFIYGFEGTAYFVHGQTYSVTHDDGVDFYIAGSSVLSAPAATTQITSTYVYNGTTGNQTFEFIYGSCCGVPAVLEATLTSAIATPEPTSVVLFATTLLGVGTLVRRRYTKIG